MRMIQAETLLFLNTYFPLEHCTPANRCLAKFCCSPSVFEQFERSTNALLERSNMHRFIYVSLSSNVHVLWKSNKKYTGPTCRHISQHARASCRMVCGFSVAQPTNLWAQWSAGSACHLLAIIFFNQSNLIKKECCQFSFSTIFNQCPYSSYACRHILQCPVDSYTYIPETQPCRFVRNIPTFLGLLTLKTWKIPNHTNPWSPQRREKSGKPQSQKTHGQSD